MKTTVLLVLGLLVSNGIYCQNLRTVTKLPGTVNETSGIEVSGPNKVWTFNDSGGAPSLYLCDTLGNLVKTIQILGAWNRDWEDITQDDQGNMYIGNIGNNNNSTTDLSIFKIPNPDLISGTTVQAEVIYYSYEDQTAFPPADQEKNFDCEALFWAEGNLYLSSKNRTVPFDGKTYLYRLPDVPGTYVAEKIDEFDTGGGDTFNYWITAGDVSPDGSKLVLLSSDKAWLFYDYSGTDFFGGKYTVLSFPSSTQKEAIVFVDEQTILLTDEDWGDVGRNLYEIKIEELEGPFNGAPHVVPGRIEAEAYDYGGNGNGYYDVSPGNEGGQFRQNDVDIEVCGDVEGDYNVGWFQTEEWLQYTVDVQFQGQFDVSFRTAGEVVGRAYLEVNQQKVGESFDVPASGGWQVWQTVTLPSIQLTQGQHALRVVMESGGFNFNYMEITDRLTATEKLDEDDPLIYPNPCKGRLYVGGDVAELEVVSALGKRYVYHPVNGSLDLGALDPGVYSVAADKGRNKAVRSLILIK